MERFCKETFIERESKALGYKWAQGEKSFRHLQRPHGAGHPRTAPWAKWARQAE
jgi:hypothetical protein